MEATFISKTTIQLQPHDRNPKNQTKWPGTFCFNFSIDAPTAVKGRINERQIEQLMTGSLPIQLCLATEERESIKAVFQSRPNFDLSKIDQQTANELRARFPEAEKEYSKEYSKGALLGGALVGLLLIGGMAAWLYRSK